jgi:hypothetical protein
LQLRQLDLRFNAVADEKVYQQQLLSALPHLAVLDGRQLQRAVGSIAGTLTMQLLKDGVTLWHDVSGGLRRRCSIAICIVASSKNQIRGPNFPSHFSPCTRPLSSSLQC